MIDDEVVQTQEPVLELPEDVEPQPDPDVNEGYMELVAQTLDHPALTTSFADYTVTEALLLLLLLCAFISACARMLRGGFSWLRS